MNNDSGWTAVFDLVNALSTAVMAIFTIVLVTLTKKQKDIADQQRAISNRQESSSRSIERAYVRVTVELPGLRIFDGQHTVNGVIVQDLEAMLRITNFGNTPARVIAGTYSMRIVDSAKVTDATYKEAIQHQAFLVPTAFERQQVLGSIPVAEIEGINRGSRRLLFAGWVVYDDIFGQRHKGGFSYQMGDLIGADRTNLGPCLVFDVVNDQSADRNFDRDEPIK
jgi:hypothetical protein